MIYLDFSTQCDDCQWREEEGHSLAAQASVYHWALACKSEVSWVQNWWEGDES